MSRDGYEIISKNVKNYHFRNEVFSCFPLEHNIPNVVVCNFYNFVCWNAAVNREIVREKYQKYTYSNRHHLHGSRTSVGLGTSFSKPLRWHVCSQRSINKQNNWIEVSLPEDYWLYQRGSVLCICMDSADAIENCCLLLLWIISKYIYFLTICTFMINIYVDRYQ